jgi:hypothetical protein
MKELKEFMGTGNSVEEWNKKREAAKLLFSQELINQLDASSYIKVFLNK